jgi:hypothetical protein
LPVFSLLFIRGWFWSLASKLSIVSLSQTPVDLPLLAFKSNQLQLSNTLYLKPFDLPLNRSQICALHLLFSLLWSLLRSSFLLLALPSRSEPKSALLSMIRVVRSSSKMSQATAS